MPRAAGRALTPRGRAFVAAGAAAALCGIALGLPSLLRVGILLVALPLLAGVLVRVAGGEVRAVRRVAPAQVVAGAPATVELMLTHAASWPLESVVVGERMSPSLGPTRRFAVRRELHTRYEVRADVRGHYVIGPAVGYATDPLGLAGRTEADDATAALVVTPRVTELPAISLAGAWSGAGEQHARAFSTGSAEDVTVRDYRHGDDLRRVHWRSTAKAGQLMVRREEQPWQNRATVLLDTRAAAWGARAGRTDAAFEHAVEIAASVTAHLLGRGLEVALATTDGTTLTSGHPASLLERLALVELVDAPALELAPDSVGLLVAVLGTMHDTDRATLKRLRASSSVASAFARTDADSAWLSAVGFRAVACPPNADVVTAWRQLGSPVAVRGAS